MAEFYPYSTARLLDAAKRDAGRIVHSALQAGTLTKQTCTQCGAPRAEAHHDDYAKPLDVTWLCRYHHRHRDADLREARRLRPAPFAAPIAKTGKTCRRSRLTTDNTIALVVQATVAISEAMDDERVNEAQIARRLKVSRQFVNTQFAGGFRSLKVLAAYADALDYDAVFVLRKRQEQEAAS